RPKAEVVYTDRLNDLSGEVDNFKLYEASLIKSPYDRVKVLTRGELTAKITLKTQFASKTAIEAIKKAGGKFEKTAVPTRARREDSRKGSK
ncbi:mitochondrial large ribosomal subunit protein uL15m, partial [Candidatus Saccharibacteria bacterium]|nr:mitochondrial large ribosomal subunit protein uL15m [Candidatus Saccharibacteria bacterium]